MPIYRRRNKAGWLFVLIIVIAGLIAVALTPKNETTPNVEQSQRQ